MRKQFFDSVGKPSLELAIAAFHHFGNSPMEWTGIDKLAEYALDEQYVQRVLDLYTYLRSSEALLLGINPCQYIKIIYKFQLATKSSPVNRQIILDCYLFLANYYVKTYNYQMEIIDRDLLHKSYLSASSKIAKLRISTLSALTRSFGEALYCDEHTIAGETYSPLEYGRDTYIVRKYTLLCAKDLRSELEDCPVRDLTIIIRYKDLIQRPTTSIVGNLLTTENMVPCIDAYCVEAIYADGHSSVVDNDGIDDLISYFSNIIPVLISNFKKASLESRLWMKILCEYYATKPYCDQIGLDWSPKQYTLNLEKLSDPKRPLVRANQALLNICDKDELFQHFVELNDPCVSWHT